MVFQLKRRFENFAWEKNNKLQAKNIEYCTYVKTLFESFGLVFVLHICYKYFCLNQVFGNNFKEILSIESTKQNMS